MTCCTWRLNGRRNGFDVSSTAVGGLWANFGAGAGFGFTALFNAVSAHDTNLIVTRGYQTILCLM
jgi:hypothetical protein